MLFILIFIPFIGVHYYLNLVTKKSQWEKPTSYETEETVVTDKNDKTQLTNKTIEQEELNYYENDVIEQEEQTVSQSHNYGDRAQEQIHHHNHNNQNSINKNQNKRKEETLDQIYVDSGEYQEDEDEEEDGLLDDEPEKIRCSHIIVKHKHSRKPYSWRDDKITRTPKEALAIIKCNFYF